MTFLILTEDLSRSEELATQINARDPNNFCLEMTSPEEIAAALGEILVDCVVLQRNGPVCDFSQSGQQPRVVLWPEYWNAADFAKRLLPLSP